MATAASGQQVRSRDRNVEWFCPTAVVPPQARDLLENYSHIPPSEVEGRVVSLRDRAWEVWPYHCLGRFRFLELNLSARDDLYPELLRRLRDGGQTLVDVGCCLGQDIRKLVHDGVPSGNLAAVELEPGFVDLGYELFRDRDTLKTRFVVGSIMEDDGVVMRELEGRFDVVHLGMILHLFGWDDQAKLIRQAMRLLKPEGDGLLIGQQAGNLEGGYSSSSRRNVFRHNDETFKKLVAEVGTTTGTRWDVKASLDNPVSIQDGKRAWQDPKARRLSFEMRRKLE